MPGKRKDTMAIREMLRRLHKGESDRAVAKAMGIDRKTVDRCGPSAPSQLVSASSAPSQTVAHLGR